MRPEQTFEKLPIPFLSKIPIIGPVLFKQDALVYLSYALVLLAAFYLYKTRAGLFLRALGENPAALDAVGINVFGLRYIYVVIGGALAGLGGAYLSLAYAPCWLENMTAGRGWIAVALVIFALWDPWRALAGSYLFGGIDALGFHLQVLGIPVSIFILNMYTQNIDPKLDFSNIREIKEVCEKVTKMRVHERHPYAGELVFTAFSGSHQDAIRKGFEYMANTKSPYWEVPYLPINPADVNREYEPVIRINSQSGKGGAAFVLQQAVGYHLPKEMHPEFGNVVKAAADAFGDELSSIQIVELFNKEYVDFKGVYSLGKHKVYEESDSTDEETHTHFEGTVAVKGVTTEISGIGNGPIDAFFNALQAIGVEGYEFINYHEIRQPSI